MNQEKRKKSFISVLLNFSLVAIFMFSFTTFFIKLVKEKENSSNNVVKKNIETKSKENFLDSSEEYNSLLKQFKEKEIDKDIYGINSVYKAETRNDDILKSFGISKKNDNDYNVAIKIDFNNSKNTLIKEISISKRSKEITKLKGEADYYVLGSSIVYNNVIGDKVVFFEDGDAIKVIDDKRFAIVLPNDTIIFSKESIN